jgi:hypothetical protein
MVEIQPADNRQAAYAILAENHYLEEMLSCLLAVPSPSDAP